MAREEKPKLMVWSRWGLGWTYKGKEREWGEIMPDFGGQPNDPKLRGLGYVAEEELAAISKCGKCGKSFRTDQALARHGHKQHKLQEKSIAALDRADEAEERFLVQNSPLHA